MNGVFVGIDAGASSTKWVIYNEEGSLLKRGRSGPVDGHIYREESKQLLNSLLEELKSEISGSVIGVCAGITGASEVDSKNKSIHGLFEAAFPESQITIYLDVSLGYETNFQNEQGIYLYAGTGSIVISRNQQGDLHAVGGWGYLLGDEGAGYWIGREAIRHVLFEIEQECEESRIREIFNGIILDINREELLKYAFSHSREDIAHLAKPLASLADLGDQKAIEILKQSARHLADLVFRAEKISHQTPAKVVFGGGIAQVGKVLISEIEKVLKRKIYISSEDLSHDAARLAITKFHASQTG